MADIVRFAQNHGIPVGPGGSAASSAVAYCLNNRSGSSGIWLGLRAFFNKDRATCLI